MGWVSYYENIRDRVAEGIAKIDKLIGKPQLDSGSLAKQNRELQNGLQSLRRVFEELRETARKKFQSQAAWSELQFTKQRATSEQLKQENNRLTNRISELETELLTMQSKIVSLEEEVEINKHFVDEENARIR